MAIHFEKFIHSQSGKIIMSILLGLGLASIFRKTCKGYNCFVFKAPPLNDIEGKIYKKEGNNCVQYTPVPTKCSSRTKIVRF